MSHNVITRSSCAICGKPNGFTAGGWLCLPPFDPELGELGDAADGAGCACQHCTAGLVMAWAREFKRQGMTPDGAPTPTSPPTGSADAPLPEVRAA